MYGPGAVGYGGGGYGGGYSPYYERPLGLGLLDDLGAVFVDLLQRAAEAARDVADTITQQTHHGAGDECITELCASARPGETANVRFNLWNTGAGALRSVRFQTTDLLGASGPIAMTVVSFTPAVVDFVRSRDAAPVAISIAVPNTTAPGVYRGLVQAEPGDDCVVLELTVLDPGPAAVQTPPAAPEPAATPPAAPDPAPQEPESGPAPEHEQ
jgi:hypothetical protein